MEHLPARPRPLRLPLGRHKKCVALHTDTYLQLRAFAQQHDLSWSGAIHELLRTHPAIGLPSLLQARQAAAARTSALEP
ncbi:hypothetical protein KBY96_14330 [Cyanobium sp. ATX 6A2]|jgi:hypothetical protein|uniref:hypothetical protein n=1 Tax=Cyanobium sp. ATX 6A2 TaxID=2823700 RepID=UPI0020CF2D8C|nr:hypothetical protein [Cyanobium sp. ATX 6A2]MCP9889100.1 hypothetical protein [Cyanobium sp. ATX 6A2]